MTNKKDYIEKLPKVLYIYYRFDNRYNKQRLSGELFFSSPLQFNDLFDSQLSCINNAGDLTHEDRERKMLELGYNEEDAKKNAKEIIDKPTDSELFHDVYHRQLNKCGILCLTTKYNNPMMWGHYSRNEGFCIAYYTKDLEKHITFGFINNMSKECINLNIKREYNIFPRPKDNDIKERQKYANEIFSIDDCKAITNSYLTDNLANEDEILAFIKNIFCKRIYIRKVKYVSSLKDLHPTLFYDHTTPASKGKYYTKLNCWKYENEYRIILSLGGNTSISLPKTAIKEIILGCNISDTSVCDILSIIKDDNTPPKLSRVYKSGNMLLRESLDIKAMMREYKKLIQTFKTKNAKLATIQDSLIV